MLPSLYNEKLVKTKRNFSQQAYPIVSLMKTKKINLPLIETLKSKVNYVCQMDGMHTLKRMQLKRSNQKNKKVNQQCNQEFCHRFNSKKVQKLSKISESAKSEKSLLKEISKNHFKGLYEWKMGELLGSGANSQVYKAFLVQTGRTIAVKIVPLQSIIKLDEINLLANLKNKLIVKYLGSDYTNTHQYIYMEYMAEKSLQDLLQSYGKLEERTVKVFLKQILKAVKYIHGRGIIHKDLKASNILITAQGEIKLSDFGCACHIQDSSKGNFKGSVLWMAPEAISSSEFTTKSDIWSIGCLAIQLLTGRLPWAECNFDNEFSAMYGIANGDQQHPKSPQSISRSMTSFLESCLSREPSQRGECDALLAYLQQ